MGKFLAPVIVLALVLSAASMVAGNLKKQQVADSSSAACSGPPATGEFEAASVAYWGGKQIEPLRAKLSETESAVLGAADESKWIEVDLSDQTIKAHQGSQTILETKISSGKPWTPTPTGEFRIWIKTRYTKMSGGVKGTSTYYYLPNVPYVMFFYNDSIPKWKGYGLHGTYWHSNFGQTMSHGCVNLPTDMAGVLFNWVDPQLPT